MMSQSNYIYCIYSSIKSLKNENKIVTIDELVSVLSRENPLLFENLKYKRLSSSFDENNVKLSRTTGFHLHLKEFSLKLAAEHKKMTIAEMSSAHKIAWGGLNDDEKGKYNSLAKKLNDEYEEKMILKDPTYKKKVEKPKSAYSHFALEKRGK